MKKAVSILLLIMIILSIAVNAFSMTAGLTASKNSIKKGESVEITVSFSEAMENITNFEFSLYFNSDVFNLTDSEIGNVNASTQISNISTDKNGSYYSISFVDTTSKGVKMQSGMVCRFVFTAKENLSDDCNADFVLKKVNVRDNKFKQVSNVSVGSAVGVSIVVNRIGDVNGDGKVDSLDLVRFAKYLANMNVKIIEKLSDINGDGSISSNDLLRLSKSLAK